MKWLAIICILVISFILAVPQLLSTHTGNRWLLTLVNQQISGTIEAKSIRLRWFGDQRIEGLVLKGKDGKTILTAERITTDAPIWTLILGGKNYGKNEVTEPKLNLVIGPQGNNLRDALAAFITPQFTLAGPPAWTKKLGLPMGSVIINNGEVTINGQTFSNIDLKASLNDELFLSVKGPFTADVKNDFVQIQKMPVLFIDAGLSFVNPELFGLATDFFGDTLSVLIEDPTIRVDAPKFNVTGTLNDLVATGQRFSLNLHYADGEGFLAGQGPNWQLPSTPFTLNENLTVENATFTYGDFKGEITKFDMPATLEVEPKDVTLIGTLKSERTEQENVILEDLQLGITEGTLAKAKWAFYSELQFPEEQFLSGAPVRIDGTFSLGPNWSLKELKGSFYMPARYLMVQFIASYSKGNINLISPLRVEYFVQQEELLQEPFKVSLIVQPTSTKLDISELNLKGTATFSDVKFKGEAASTITNLEGTVDINFPKNVATIDFSGKTSAGEELGKVKGSAKVQNFYSKKNFTLDQANLQGKALFSPIPTAAFSLLWDEPNLTELLGPTVKLDSTFNFSSLKPAKGNITATLSSKYAEGKAVANFDEKTDLTFNFKDHSSNGAIDLTGEYFQKTLNVQGSATNLTMSWMATLLGIGHEGLLKAVFGPTVNLKGSASSNGPLSINIDSDNAKASFQGNIKKQILTLTAPLTAEVKVTPELGKEILEYANPIFAQAVRSENPIAFTVQPEGFSLPLFPLEIDSLQVSKATLDLGKIWMKNRGIVRALLSLSRLSEGGEVLAWSTPLYLSVKNGVADYKRMDTLIGSRLHIASWGTINLPRKRVDMTFGIPTHGAYLTIPFRGTLPNVNVDWKKTGLRLATALASPEAALLTGALTTKVPPPTTQPFPWGGEEPTPAETPKVPKIKPKDALKALKKVLK